MTLQVDDSARVRTLTLDRPEALNAFNEAMYDALAEALNDAAEDPSVAVVLLTGNGRGFSAGTDLIEMHQIATDPTFQRGRHGFPGLVDALDAFPKPLVSPSTASASASAAPSSASPTWPSCRRRRGSSARSPRSAWRPRRRRRT